MDPIKEAFINLALRCNALKFGEFTLKSGRMSPYFFNAGLFYQGEALRELGEFYAQTLIKNKAIFEHLFGPAYKGLPLATSTAIALAQMGRPTTVTFNRKEKKEHGEGGELIGAPLSGHTIMIDDVITAGTAFRESQKFITENGGTLTGVIIALDRCERGVNEQSTVAEIKAQGIDVFSIISLPDLINFLQKNNEKDRVEQIKKYQEVYGA